MATVTVVRYKRRKRLGDDKSPMMYLLKPKAGESKIYSIDSLAQEILIRTGKLPEDTTKLRVEQLLELAKDELNGKDYTRLANAFDEAVFYRDEVLEDRGFNAGQLATALRDLFKDTTPQKRKSLVSKIEAWIQTDQDLKTLEAELVN